MTACVVMVLPSVCDSVLTCTTEAATSTMVEMLPTSRCVSTPTLAPTATATWRFCVAKPAAETDNS